jgi:hypothetical protein
MAATDRVMELTRKAFMRTWGNPEMAHAARDLDNRAYRYQRLWELYDGTAFTNMDAWQQYKSVHGLYRQIRQIYDHVHELVEFYATHIWSGSLAKDGLHLPDGVLNAVPLAEDTSPKLAAAIAQLFTWWNFQEVMTVIPRYSGALGELLVELRDDPQRGKVLINLIWPGYITDVRLDESGNLIYYCIEYSYYDREDRAYHAYRREVDKVSMRTYRDDKPYNYEANPIPEGADPDGTLAGLATNSDGLFDRADGYEVPNPYGFVPAVWFRHHRVIGVRGEPAVWSTQAQLDEINSLYSHMIDKAHVSLRSPILISGNIAPFRLRTALTNAYGAVKRTFTSDLDNQRSGMEEIEIIEGPQGTEMKTIELRITEAGEAIDRIIKGIEKKCPEITFYSELRSMTQLTGPGASRLLGDVDRKVKMVAAGYDHELIKLLQMGIAIAGWRLRGGDDKWAERTTAQEKFDGFDLDSYAKGDLDFDIMPRDLVPMTPKDRLEIIQMKRTAMPWIPDEVIGKEAGYRVEEVKQWAKQYERKQQQKLEQQMQATQKAPFGQGVRQNGDTPTPIKRPVGAPSGGPQRGAPVQNRRSAAD